MHSVVYASANPDKSADYSGVAHACATQRFGVGNTLLQPQELNRGHCAANWCVIRRMRAEMAGSQRAETVAMPSSMRYLNSVRLHFGRANEDVTRHICCQASVQLAYCPYDTTTLKPATNFAARE